MPNSPNLEEQDTLLHQLIQQVVEYTDGSPEQTKVMDRLLRLIPNLTGIYRRRDYLEALNLALEDISAISLYQGSVSGRKLRSFVRDFRGNINNAEPGIVRKNFVTWFNRIVNSKVIDIQRQQQRQQLKAPLSLDNAIKQDEGKTTFGEILPDSRTLGDIESLLERKQQPKKQRKALILELYIEKDPEGKLRGCYYKDKSGKEYRECNCQLLFQELCLTNPGTEVTLREGNEEITRPAEKQTRVADIARNFGIPYISISSRLLPRCQKLIKQILQEIEDNFDDYIKRLIGE